MNDGGNLGCLLLVDNGNGRLDECGGCCVPCFLIFGCCDIAGDMVLALVEQCFLGPCSSSVFCTSCILSHCLLMIVLLITKPT
jgi:hypothetical protein